MRKALSQYNQIFLAGAVLLLTILMTHALPASAAENTTYTLYGQEWSGGGNQTVTYGLTSQDEGTACTYYFDDGSETGSQTGTLSGDTTGKLVFQWTTPGVYTFDLEATTANRTNYTYDRTVYRIRVYARNTDPFVTVQNLSKVTGSGEADDGKVNEILFQHRYTAPTTPDGGGDSGGDNGGSGGGSTNPGTNGTTTPTETITESGNLLDNIVQTITEWGSDQDETISIVEGGNVINHSNKYTGDDSHMILYGFISILAIITLTVWLIRHKRA